jgi:hypothetical protein
MTDREAFSNSVEARSAARQERIRLDIQNQDRDAPIRKVFHAFLEDNGFAPQTTPAPGYSYPGSHAQTLWECFLAATLAERFKDKS